MRRRFLILIVAIFIVLSAIFFALKSYAPDYQFSVLMTGNLVWAILTAVSYTLVTRQEKGSSAAFVRGVFGASFLKLMIGMVGILVYVAMNRGHIHKPTVFILLGLYIVYNIPETLTLSKQARMK